MNLEALLVKGRVPADHEFKQLFVALVRRVLELEGQVRELRNKDSDDFDPLDYLSPEEMQ
jgi:hypothetical protein